MYIKESMFLIEMQNGINRQYKLGQWLRNRYDGFLTKEYFPQDIFVYATNLDRTIMSASAAAAGLYPPTGNQIWNADLLWYPIPVRTAPIECASIVINDRKCPKYQKLLEETKKSDYFQDINRNHSKLFQLIEKNTGFMVKDIEPLKWLHFNFFLATEDYNQNLIPSWAKESEDAFEDLAGLAFARDCFSDAMKRFQCGPFFNYLITNFEKISKKEIAPKFVMISAHDSSLIPVLNTMGVYDNKPPSFAATIIWELKTNANGEDYINIFYKRKQLEEITLKNCEFNCSFAKFKEILQPFNVDIDSWVQECNSN